MVQVKSKILYNDTDYIPNIRSVTWEQPELSFAEIPTFEFETDNFHGRVYDTYEIGKNIKIYRNSEKVFHGVIEPREFKKGKSGNTAKIRGKHKGYRNLQNSICEIYRSPENGVVVNPWQWGRKKADGSEVDGINPSDIFRNLIGVKFTHQNFLDNRQFFIDKDASGTKGWIGVSLSDKDLEGEVKLTGVPSGDLWTLGSGTTPGQAHSISLHNGPIITKDGTTVRGMGNITKIEVKIFGDKGENNIDPIIKVCTNGNEVINSRNYSTVSLNSPGTGSNVVWSGSITVSGGSNQLGYAIYPNGNSTGSSSYTNSIDYIRIDCDTESDTGVTAGTIDTYENPSGHTHNGDSGDNIAVNLAGFNRLDACERVRKVTVTDDDILDSPHWDGWINNDLQLNFKKRRGSNKATEYSFAKRNVTNIEHHFDADHIQNNIIAKGVGTPPHQLTIQSTELVDLDSINKYGNRQGIFLDSNITDSFTLYTRAKSYFKTYKDPLETVKMKTINDWGMDWNVGDKVKVKDSDIGVDGHWRIIKAKHKIVGNGNEVIDVELGTKSYNASQMLRGINDKMNNQELFYAGTQGNQVTSSLSIDFDKDKPAVYNFIIPTGVDIDRVYLYAKTDVFKANSKAASSKVLSNEAIVAGGGGGSATSEYPTTHNHGGSTWKNVGSHSYTSNKMFVLLNAQVQGEVTSNEIIKFRINDGTDIYESPAMIHKSNESDPGWDTATASMIVLYPKNPNGKTLNVDFYSSRNPNNNYYVRYKIMDINAPSHNHGTEGHSHDIQFGIYEFSGDAGTYNSGSAMYPTQIQMFVDEMPSDAGAVPYEPWGQVGNTSGSVTIDKLDITEALKDANGNIRAGSHFIAFKPAGAQGTENGDSNLQNLGSIAVNHFLTFNTKGAVD